jgi:hypothetical protein
MDIKKMKKTAMAVNHIKKGIDRSLGPSPWDAALKVDLNMHAYMEAFKVHIWIKEIVDLCSIYI